MRPALYLPVIVLLLALIFRGAALDWLTPFAPMCGVALVIGYALLGATWEMRKTFGDAEQHGRRS
jgi:cytochrome d ubiquinol oxidase subunit II